MLSHAKKKRTTGREVQEECVCGGVDGAGLRSNLSYIVKNDTFFIYWAGPQLHLPCSIFFYFVIIKICTDLKNVCSPLNRIALGNAIYFWDSTELERIDRKRTSNNRVRILCHVDLKRSEKGASRSTCTCYILGIISVNHHWAYMKKKKNEPSPEASTSNEREGQQSPRWGRPVCGPTLSHHLSLWVMAATQSSLLAFISCLFSLSAYPSVQMRFSVTLNLPEMKFSCKVRTVNRSEKMEQKKCWYVKLYANFIQRRRFNMKWIYSCNNSHIIGVFPSLVYMHLRSQSYRILRCLATYLCLFNSRNILLSNIFPPTENHIDFQVQKDATFTLL